MKHLTLIFVIISLLSIPLFAQGFGIGPQVGFQKAKDAEEGKLMGGAALRFKLTPALGIEGSINFRQEDYADESVSVTSWPVLVTGLFYPLPIAYGAVGFGWYNTTIEYDDIPGVMTPERETSQEIGWHFGAGVELPFSPRVSFTGDIKYVFLNYDFEEIPGSDDLDSDFYMATVGLLFGL